MAKLVDQTIMKAIETREVKHGQLHDYHRVVSLNYENSKGRDISHIVIRLSDIFSVD